MTTATTSTTITEMTSIAATNTLTAANTIAVAPSRLRVLGQADLNEWNWRRGMLATVDPAMMIPIIDDSTEDAVVLRLENRGRATVGDPTVIVDDSTQTVHVCRVMPQMIDRTTDAGTRDTDQEQAETAINARGLMANVIATSSADMAAGLDLTAMIRIGSGQGVDTSTRNMAMIDSTVTIDGTPVAILTVAIFTNDITSDIATTVNSADIDLRDMATIDSTAIIDGTTAIILMVTIARDDIILDIGTTVNSADIDLRDTTMVDLNGTIDGTTGITLTVAASMGDITSNQTHGNLLIARMVIGSEENRATADGIDHRLTVSTSTATEKSRKTKSFSCTPRSTRTVMAQ